MAIRQHPLLAGLLAALWMTIVFAAAVGFSNARTEPIDSFISCAQAGYPITYANPPICRQGSFYVLGPVGAQAVQTEDVVDSDPIDLLVSADSGTATARAQVVVQSEVAWEEWWRKLHAGLALPPLLPVDFTTNSVVIIVGGPKATTGYGFKVTAVTRNKKTTVIDINESIPTIGCPVANQLSNRYSVVRTSKLADPVVFRNTNSYRHCN